MEWRDITTYSQSEVERIPRVLVTTIIDKVEIIIHRSINWEKDRWLLTCRYLDIEKKPLNNKDLEKAKLEGFYCVDNKLTEHVILSKKIKEIIRNIQTK